MESGSVQAWRFFRFVMRGRSGNLYFDLKTTDEVSGGTSIMKAYGSALRNLRRPFLISYLYSSPGLSPGMNRSQIPDAPRLRIGCFVPSQSLKFPITLTRSAFGLHTANATPRFLS